MKLNLLELTQSILSSLNSDEVNSIGDTTESTQVAEIVRTTYFNMMNRYDLPKHDQLIQLVPSGNTALPVLMYLPDGTNKVNWIKYYNENPLDVSSSTFEHDLNLDINAGDGDSSPAPSFGEVSILSVKSFLDMVNTFNIDNTDVDTFTLTLTQGSTGDPLDFVLRYKNNKMPQFCTILQNFYVIFDSFDGDIDNTLQASKTMVNAWVLPSFTLEDSFTPDLDDRLFPLLLNEAKSLAFLELKQTVHQKAEKEVNRQTSTLQKFKSVSDIPSSFDALPNFGRR